MNMLLRTIAVIALASAGCRDIAEHDRPDATGRDGATADAARPDAAADPSDGTPIRKPCTSSFGSALDTSYGRLDGILVAIVKPGVFGCNGDSDHIHLQIEIAGSRYDVAINAQSDVLTTARDAVVSLTPWTEGWHPGTGFEYTSLVHSTDFAAAPDLVTQLTDELETVNHISIYSRGYGPDGTHLVHYNNGLDGAIVMKPLAAKPHVRMYRFTNQSF